MQYQFRTKFAEDIFHAKYAHQNCETWPKLARTMVQSVCGEMLSKEDKDQLVCYIEEMKFLPGGRYIYYAGREARFYNNCFLLRAEDTREGWADLTRNAMSCLMAGGGIGVDYSQLRPSGSLLKKTGGITSGPMALMKIINEVGRYVRQGGARRSAIWAGLHCNHQDILEFLHTKDWSDDVKKLKAKNFDFPAELDCTNISIIYDEQSQIAPDNWVFRENVEQALRTGEPGFSFNFGKDKKETLRNACCEVTSEDDSDVCNIGSVNFSRIESIDQLQSVVELATKFLLCGSITGQVPYRKVEEIRERNRRIGLGVMGLHEWLLQRDYDYAMNDELSLWLENYRQISEVSAYSFADRLAISRPVKLRSIAPTGTIAILAGTTTGIEPLFAVAYKRRYLEENIWKFQYVIDGIAKYLVENVGIAPNTIETALDLSADPEKRIAFQAEVQKYVDHAISSTVNLPKWGNEYNNLSTIDKMTDIISRYAGQLRGLTFYPDGARGGQPLTPVDYEEACAKQGEVYEESHDICALAGKGTCEL